MLIHMKLLKECKDEKIQSRDIEITSYEYDATHIVVCGVLCDRRLVPTFSVDMQKREPATVHHMRICMKVNTDTFMIEEIEAELPETPHRECAGMYATIQRIKGLTLSPGFTSHVRKKLGGRKGCIHLTTLLLAMAPAALQGYWVHNDRKPDRRKLSGANMERYLIDTCYVWRREGPLVQKIAELAGVEIKSGNDSSK